MTFFNLLLMCGFFLLSRNL